MTKPERSLSPADGADLRSILAAELSPDGSQIAYAISTLSPDGAEDRIHLRLIEVESAEERDLTAPDALDLFPTWAPDGGSVVFLSTRSGAPQVHRVQVVGDAEPEQLTERGAALVPPRVSPDGKRILFASPAQAPRDPSLPYRVTNAFWRLDTVGLLRDAVSELFVLALGDGEPEQLTHDGALLVGASWSPDGTSVLSMSLAEADEPRFALRRIDLSSGEETALWDGEFLALPPVAVWRPDGGIVRSGENRVVGSAEKAEIFLTAAEAGAEEELCSAGIEGWVFGILQGNFPCDPFVFPRIVVSPGGETAWVHVQSGGRLETWSIPLEGEDGPRRIVSGDQATTPLDASDELLLVATTSLHAPGDLWLVDHGGENPRRMTDLHSERFAPEAHVEVQPLAVTGADGTPVEAWFLRPSGSEGRVPTVLNVHGGPHLGWGHSFLFDACLLADAGYATLLVNQRGSVGYDPEFARRLHGDWGNFDAGDLEAALDAAIDAGWADEARLAVRGGSAGAHLTAWQITHSDRFAAAIVESPALDWNTMIGSDLGWVFQRWFSGGALGRDATYADRGNFSPAAFAERCTTPTLIIQHENDLRAPAANSDAFFAHLKLAQCPVEMLRMPGSWHDGSTLLGNPTVRVAENEALLEWLERWMPAAG